jgi:hypothetical protein
MSKPIREYEISETKDGRLSFLVQDTQFGKYILELNRQEKTGFYYTHINLTKEELEHLYKAIGTELACQHPNMITGLRGNGEQTVEYYECPDCGYYLEQGAGK